MGQAIPVNPAQAVVPIPDTSSHALGLEGEGDKFPETSTSSLRRVVEKTVDKLGRTRSLNNRSTSKRIFSLGRSKGKEPGTLGVIQIHSHPLSLVLTSRLVENTMTPTSAQSRDTKDDSPFVNPPSPATAIRPSLGSFPVHGSVSALSYRLPITYGELTLGLDASWYPNLNPGVDCHSLDR